MKPKIVPPSEVAAEINAALQSLARDLESKDPKEDREEARKTRLNDLLTVLEMHEALPLIRLIVEPRIKCANAKCNKVVAMSRASGAFCLDCSQRMTWEAEAHS